MISRSSSETGIGPSLPHYVNANVVEGKASTADFCLLAQPVLMVNDLSCNARFIYSGNILTRVGKARSTINLAAKLLFLT